MKMESVTGMKKGDIRLFALSTCAWCKKTKALLSELGVAYQYVFVDLLKGADKEAALDELERWNPACSFPTIVFDDAGCVVGFKPEDIRARLGK